MSLVTREIFKAYDIRGIVGETLTPEMIEVIGHAIGSEAIKCGQHTIVIARDGRLSGPELIKSLACGIQKSGIDVIDIGCVTTPMAYFAAFYLNTNSCVVLTGSHNPPDYNGVKIVLAGVTLYGDAIQALRCRIDQHELTTGAGHYTQQDIGAAYMARIVSDVKLARTMKITVDCGNGVAGAYVAKLYRALGCLVEELYCEVDGHFPNHHPDPSVPENLQALIAAVKNNGSELGLAFDGDGDRLGVVTKEGNIIYSDRQLMLFAADMLTRNPGASVIFDIKSTRHLFGWIRSHGGIPIIWKTGHSLIKAKMRETGALLGGEMTGHLFFVERWYGFDDGLYGGARLLEILSRVNDPSAVLNALPCACCTPELHIKTGVEENYALLEKLRDTAFFTGAIDIITIDGLRVEFVDGFGLVRASNTTPAIVLRFEADNDSALERIQDEFRSLLLSAAPHLIVPF